MKTAFTMIEMLAVMAIVPSTNITAVKIIVSFRMRLSSSFC